MKAYCESGGIAHAFLTSALDRGEWSVSRPGRFTPSERAPGTHWIRSWVDPGAGPNAVVKKKKVPALTGTRNLDHSPHSSVLYH
jgi:hypothetical protein